MKAQGYEIIQEIVFEDGHGFAMGGNSLADFPYGIWQFTEIPDGKRDYYLGRYEPSLESAIREFKRRKDNYQFLFHVDRKMEGKRQRMYYRYYSTQRPVDIGTYPNRPIVIVNYDVDRRCPVAGGIFCAWGEVTYDVPLTKEEIEAYELKPSPCNQDQTSRTLLREFLNIPSKDAMMYKETVCKA